MNNLTNPASTSNQSLDAPDGCVYQSGSLTSQARAMVEAAGLPFDVLARAPYAAATFIKSTPQLTARKNILKIAVIEAHTQDIGCAGALYQLIPEWVGSPSLEIKVDLVGPDVFADFVDAELSELGLQPATIHPIKTAQWWKSLTKDERPDLILVFHPCMEMHHNEWMRSIELPKILKANIPVVFTTIDLDQCQRDAYILEAYGGVIEKHPAAIKNIPDVSMNGFADFGRAVFSARGFKKNPRAEVNDALEVVQNLILGLDEGFVKIGDIMSHHDIGRPAMVMRRGASREVMHLISDIYLDPQKEELFTAQDGAENPCGQTLPAPRVAGLIKKQPSAFERALLIGEIFGQIQMYRSFGLF